MCVYDCACVYAFGYNKNASILLRILVHLVCLLCTELYELDME